MNCSAVLSELPTPPSSVAGGSDSKNDETWSAVLPHQAGLSSSRYLVASSPTYTRVFGGSNRRSSAAFSGTARDMPGVSVTPWRRKFVRSLLPLPLWLHCCRLCRRRMAKAVRSSGPRSVSTMSRRALHLAVRNDVIEGVRRARWLPFHRLPRVAQGATKDTDDDADGYSRTAPTTTLTTQPSRISLDIRQCSIQLPTRVKVCRSPLIMSGTRIRTQATTTAAPPQPWAGAGCPQSYVAGTSYDPAETVSAGGLVYEVSPSQEIQ